MTEQKILIVDDNTAICHVLEEMFRDEGYFVTLAFRGDDALTELKLRNYQLVLLDLKLPGLYGTEVLRQIKTDYPKTDVVMMTSHASVDTAVEALRLGAQDYLTKPFEDLETVLVSFERYSTNGP